MEKVERHYAHDCDNVVLNNSIDGLIIFGNNLFRELTKSKKRS